MSQLNVRGLALLGLALLCASCFPDEPSVPASASHAPDQPPEFDGFPLSGSSAQALKAGFTDCEPEFDTQLLCMHKEGLPVMGVRAYKVGVVLTALQDDEFALRPNISELKMSGLAFSEIRFLFAKAEYEASCVAKHPEAQSYLPPDECAKPDNIAAFRQALRNAGWTSTLRRKRTEYFNKPGHGIEVDLYTDFDGTERVTVKQVSLEHVTERWTDYEYMLRAREARETREARGPSN